MEAIVLAAYFICLAAVSFYSLAQFQLAWVYHRRSRQVAQQHTKANPSDPSLPKVAVQLPIYNERYVVERLLQHVSALKYPKHLLEVQLLDDSDDETSAIAAKALARLQRQGITVKHLKRRNRKGYKAGALQYGLERTDAALLAIFDADFLPKPDFLLQTVPHFANGKVGVVQTRWGHANQRFSLLTKLQAFGLDAHFTIEQSGRSLMGNYISFNGTAGLWRKACILDAGGWHYDTLTEDLDLSYRAQFKGWQFRYLEDVVTPAELPVFMSALKSQQFRWNKGAAESAKKHLRTVLFAPIPLRKKVHAFFHLANSTMFMLMMVAAILSIPTLFIKQHHPEWGWAIKLASVFLVGFIGISFFYWAAAKARVPHRYWRYFLGYFPFYLSLYMGLSFYNSIAVIEGWSGRKSAFIRTPKFNITSGKKWQGQGTYLNGFAFSWVELMEGLLCLYFAFGMAMGVYYADLGLLLFHAMLTFGFGMVFYYSVKPMGGGARH